MRKTTRKMNTAIFELRMCQLGVRDADQYTMGMVYDMLTEQANDQEHYDQLATQEDINRFLG